MSLIIRIPLRVSFCGGGTDFQPFYMDHGGAVLFSNIAKYAYISLSKRDDGQVIIRDVDFGVETVFKFDEVPSYDGFLDLTKAVLNFLKVKQGVDIMIKSDVAPGSGLGTSSAISAGLLKGLIELFALKIPNHPKALAEMAYTVERDILDMTGGKQDQYAAVFKGINFVEFSSVDTEEAALNVRSSFLNDFQMNSLLCYTGLTHHSSDIIKEQFAQLNIPALLKIKTLTYELRERFEEENITDIARLINESYRIKRDLHKNITNDTINKLYFAGMDAGAWGGKLLGAGGGGYLFFIVPFERQQKVKQALRDHGGQPEPFIFDMEGVKIWKSRI